ncbi:MAG: NAD(P)/FAD-dependent oxidoreductase [Archangium sp.]|nr:NAD(P)/FAD-dependent oxidoreductase [Archangium sp.]
MMTCDAVVIGAGVVGLAIARELARGGREVLVLEAEDRFGTQTSSRNSEVIHAGLYYPPGSLKARLCVEGQALLYRFCAEHGVPHRRIGKLLIATDDAERPRLDALAKNAAANGVHLQPLDAKEVSALEPEVTAVAGLWSPTTGIVDSHALMHRLLVDAEAHGAKLVTRTPVVGGRGRVLDCGGAEPVTLRCRTVVNAAGLNAQRVATALRATGVPPTHYAKGHYFTLRSPSPFSHLVYPMPDSAGLGIHVTLDLTGACKFGPDVTSWPAAPEYSFDAGLEDKFERAVRRYWPALPEHALQPGFTGIRPKVSGPGEAPGDFVIERGVQGLVHLFGIESPGLTAALAIAAYVAAMLKR